MWAALPRRGAVAQMGERCNRTAEVRGSIPLSSTSLEPIKSTTYKIPLSDISRPEGPFGIAPVSQLTYSKLSSC
jgi:hypothetical protein